MKILFFAMVFFQYLTLGYSQDESIFQEKIKVVHKYDFRVKENNKYLGLYYGGAQGVWTRTQNGHIKAQYYLEEERLRDLSNFEKKITENLESDFDYDLSGRQINFSKPGVPIYRNFPYHPPEKSWATASTWISSGEIVQDWDNSGIFTTVPILTEYKVLGLRKDPMGDFYEISALHALRYRKGMDPKGSPRILSIQGSQESLIQWPVGSLNPRFFRVKITEEVKIPEKTTTRTGFWLTWFKGVIPLPKEVVKNDIDDIIKSADLHDIDVEVKEEGIQLRLQNLLFKADEAVLLPGANLRLDSLATSLKKIPQRTVLITGHTAATGQPNDEMILSVERAKSIVEALKARGIEAKRLLYEGRGSTRPVGDNGTPEGRSQNRRVELTILED